MNKANCACSCKKDGKYEKVKNIIKTHKEEKGALIQILNEVQKVYGYLPEDILEIISEELDIKMSEIYGVSTFYSNFALEPKGKYIIKVCLGTACYVKGAKDILERLSSILQIEIGKTTEDGLFTLEEARCLGGCGLAPVIMVNEKVFGRLVPDDLIKIIDEYKSLG